MPLASTSWIVFGASAGRLQHTSVAAGTGLTRTTVSTFLSEGCEDTDEDEDKDEEEVEAAAAISARGELDQGEDTQVTHASKVISWREHCLRTTERESGFTAPRESRAFAEFA